MAKATSSQAWLWHRRLSHLNFDTINLLSKNDIVVGLPKMKFVKDHLCSPCELGKAKRKSFHFKLTPSSKRRLQLLHMDLCSPMRVASMNGKRYVFVIVDDYSRYTWTYFLRSKDETPKVLIDFLRLVQRGLQAQVRVVRTDKGMEFLNQTLHAYFAAEGIKHQTSVARTPEQNGVVERRNRTLVEAARTLLSAAKVPLFFWAEAIATECFTQNRSLVIPRHEKTPYHIINERKPSVKFFHIFGSVCYIVRDGENLDKMKEKGDECIFVGYSNQSRAYRVFNKRTRVIMESIHVNFDELPHMVLDQNCSDPAPECQTMALEHDSLSPGRICQENVYHGDKTDQLSSDPAPKCQTMVLEHDSLSPGRKCQENVSHGDKTGTTSNELDLLFSSMFDELLNGTPKVVSKSFATMASVQNSSDPAPECQTTALNHDSLSLTIQRQEKVTQADMTVTTLNELDLLFSLMFDELLNGSSKVVSKSFVVSAADAPNQRQQYTTPLNNHTTPVPTCQVPTLEPTVISSENINQAETYAENDQVTDDEFINIFFNPVQDQGETSTRHNTNVLNHGMHKIHTDHTQTRTSKLPPDSRKTNKRVTFSTGVISSNSVSRPQLKSNPMEDRVLCNNSRGKKQEVEDHRRNVKLPKNKTSVTACNDSLNAKTLNVKSVSRCDKCVLHDKHDMCVLKSIAKPIKRTVASESIKKLRNFTRKIYEDVSKTCSWWYPKSTPSGYIWKPKSRIENVNLNLVEIVLFIVDSGCSKHMTGNLKLLINFVEKFLGTVKIRNDQIAPILGYGDLVQGAITNDIVVGLPKVKFIKDHLCSSCELGKAKRKSFYTKLTPSSKRRLQLLHMDLCGSMRVASVNGKRYVLVIVDDYSIYTWTHFLRSKDETPEVLIDFLRLVQRGLQAQVGVVRTDKGTKFLNQTLHPYFAAEGIQHRTSVARTPKQNGVVERRNCTLVEAARTMLSAAKVPLFFWAEAIATA
nr:retrovirus-related Pol polyprotein from transposon TNT 1-94 [Tanacetum cinerariifolium]